MNFCLTFLLHLMTNGPSLVHLRKQRAALSTSLRESAATAAHLHWAPNLAWNFVYLDLTLRFYLCNDTLLINYRLDWL